MAKPRICLGIDEGDFSSLNLALEFGNVWLEDWKHVIARTVIKRIDWHFAPV